MDQDRGAAAYVAPGIKRSAPLSAVVGSKYLTILTPKQSWVGSVPWSVCLHASLNPVNWQTIKPTFIAQRIS